MPSPSQVNALVIDDHPLMASALISSMESMRVFDSIASRTSLEAAFKLLNADQNFQLIVLDLNLGDTEGVSTLEAFREQFSHIPVIIFSAEESTDVVVAVFEAGARGFIHKSSDGIAFREAMTAVLAGGSYVPEHAAEQLGAQMPASRAAIAHSTDNTSKLTQRQRDVLSLLLQGTPNKLIADQLGMAEGTVKTHLNMIYRILAVRNRAQAIIKATQMGLA